MFGKIKLCFCCRREKPVDQFGRSRSSHDGLLGVCRACVQDLRRVKT